jgi:arginyl-tRNA synthetase
MASRDGTVVLLEDLIEEATNRALQSYARRTRSFRRTEIKGRQAVGIGAIKYPMLSRESAKVVTFDWESPSISTAAAPYIQYAFVRANSILRKAGGEIPTSMRLIIH